MSALDYGSLIILADIRELDDLRHESAESISKSHEKYHRLLELSRKYDSVNIIKVLLNFIESLKAQNESLQESLRLEKIENESLKMNKGQE